MVVECHGGSPVLAQGTAAGLVGRAGFREFAAASVTAFAVAFGVGQGVGLLVVVGAVFATLAVRLLVHHRLGGFTGRLVAAAGETVEMVVLALLAGLAQLNK